MERSGNMTKEIMTNARKQAWKECLILWEAIESIPSYIEYDLCIKHYLLNALGFGSKVNSCPMCDYSNCMHNKYTNSNGALCPIQNDNRLNYRYDMRCLSTAYSKWEIEDDNELRHQFAETFYKYLINLAKKEGYKPDFNLKYW